MEQLRRGWYPVPLMVSMSLVHSCQLRWAVTTGLLMVSFWCVWDVSMHRVCGWETNLLSLFMGTLCRCDWCGISESVQGLHREPNLNAAVKFRMMTSKTILVKLWNNSATRKVVPPFCIISWWSQGGPGNQEHATNTEWPDFSVSPFLMLPVLGWKSRINFTRPHWAHFCCCWVYLSGLFWHENVTPH